MRKSNSRPAEALDVADFDTSPVWEFVNDDCDETAVRPVTRFPLKHLNGRLIGTKVLLANGQLAWGLLGNIDAANAMATREFATLSIECRGRWFMLARYFDVDFDRRGPNALASFLELSVKEVFPISYDLTPLIWGDPSILRGKITAEPQIRLSSQQRIKLALRKR